MDELRPKLRAVLQPHAVRTEDGKQVVALLDPTGLVENHVVFQPELLPLFALLNGVNTLQDIRDRWKSEFGQEVSLTALSEFVQRLDETHFLVSERFDRYVDGLRDAYAAAAYRESKMAGAAYPGEPAELRRFLAGFFNDRPAAAATDPVLGLVAPHIDLEAGGAVYAAAYRALARPEPSPLFVILGTDHFGWHRFTATRKGFQTPFGPAESDQAFLVALQDRLDEPLFEDEFKHAWEHSIEFQALWLKYLWPDQPVHIAPIMCGSFGDAVADGRSPGESPDVAAMCTALRDLIQEWPRPVCIIAGADLAHVGLRFGEEQAVTQTDLPQVESADRQLIEHVLAVDPEAMAGRIILEQDARSICGFPPIYVMLKALDATRGELLEYGISHEPDTGSCVSFAAIAFR